MLIDWRGHINVESASNSKCVLYLYDYLFKGLKKVLAEARKEAIERGETGKEVDEIKLFIKGRLLCAMDATWRAFGYNNYPPQTPTVKLVNVMLESQYKFFLEKGKATDMLMYIHRPSCLHHLMFEDFFKEWHYATKRPISTRAEFHKITFQSPNKSFYIVKWIRNSTQLVRLNMIYPNAGELWYLRLILRNRAVISYKDAYVHDNVSYSTFQKSADAAGYLTGESEAFECFEEAYNAGNKTPSKLRALFCMLTVDGSNTIGILSLEKNVEAMTEDFLHRDHTLSKKGNKTIGISLIVF